MRRLLLIAALAIASLRGGESPAPSVKEKLRGRLLETLPPPAPASGESDPKVEVDDEILELAPMTIRRSLEADLLAEAQRAAEAKKAKEFSLLRGGSIYSFRRGEIGFWPKIVPTDATPVKKGSVGITVDFLRLKW